MPEDVVLGEVVGVFGFRGELRLQLYHREGGTLFGREVTGTLVAPDGTRRDVRLTARSGAGKRVLARIAGVDTEDAARALQGYTLVVGRDVLPPPAEGEYYLHDILGLPVRSAAGEPLGTLADVVAGERDVWVIERPDGSEAYVLAAPEAVLKVDLGAGEIVLADGATDPGE